jgi:glutamate dehydrogenase
MYCRDLALDQDGYNYRKLLAITEAFPREALFQIANEDLYCICLHVLSATNGSHIKIIYSAG